MKAYAIFFKARSDAKWHHLCDVKSSGVVMDVLQQLRNDDPGLALMYRVL